MKKEENIENINISKIVKSATKLYGIELKRHNDASHPLNLLLFLVDNGYEKVKELQDLNKEIIGSYSQSGFTVIMNIPVAFGGSGKKIKTWMICDLPLITYISIKLNKGKILPIHKKVIDHISSLMDTNGWRCLNCGNIGKFRGPGKKADECPIATLNSLKLLSLTKADEYKDEKEMGINTILNLWKDRKERRPYLFGMGTDFGKLKYPLVWYDILNVANALSYFPDARKKKGFTEMITIIRKKVKQNGYVPESVYQYWKEFDFGQKKVESMYIRKTIEGIISRIST
jgi:hypothetical protein